MNCRELKYMKIILFITIIVFNIFCLNQNTSGRPSSNAYKNLAILSMGYSGSIKRLPDMQFTRYDHTTTVLQDGRILITGGNPDIQTSEIYDSSLEKFISSGNLLTNRRLHTANLLKNGRVIIVGGANLSGAPTLSEIFLPNSGIFVNGPDFGTQRYAHTATELENGKILVAGGILANSSLSSAQIYDPDTNSVTNLSATLQNSRAYHTATRLKNGRVLFIGGSDEAGDTTLNSMEIYDPNTNTFSPVGNLINSRKFHTAILMSTGAVLVSGGEANGSSVGIHELIDPENFSTISIPMETPRSMHSATQLPSGRILLAGGRRFIRPGTVTFLNSSEIYDPQLNLSIVGQRISQERSKVMGIVLPNGTTLLTGGLVQSGSTSIGTGISELYINTPDSSLLGPYLLYGCFLGEWC